MPRMAPVYRGFPVPGSSAAEDLVGVVQDHGARDVVVYRLVLLASDEQYERGDPADDPQDAVAERGSARVPTSWFYCG